MFGLEGVVLNVVSEGLGLEGFGLEGVVLNVVSEGLGLEGLIWSVWFECCISNVKFRFLSVKKFSNEQS